MCLHFSLNLTMHADVPITSVNLPSKKLQFQYTGIIPGPDTKFQLVYFCTSVILLRRNYRVT